MKKVFNSIKGIGVFLGLNFIFCLYLFPVQQIDFNRKPIQWERSRTFDAQHYLIKINLDIEGKSFTGETTLILSSLKEDLKRIKLDAEDFKVEKVINEWGQPLAFEQQEKKLIIDLDRAYSFGETIVLTIFYRSDPRAHQTPEKKKGLRFYQATSEYPALVASDSWPDGVHHWFPCYDFPNDKVTDEIIATVKEPNKVVANGRLLKVIKNPEENTVTYHWLQDKPHSTYLIFLAAAPYEVLHDHYQTIPINYWVFPQHVQDALRSYQKTPKMMEFFIKTFGTPYPWAKYDQVSVPFGGGAESTSATAMTYRIIHDEKAEKDFSSIDIVSHELAHQWWGDLITLRSWEHSWMNESFATYCEYLYWNYDRGPEEGAIDLLSEKDYYLQEAKNKYIRPIVTNHYQVPQDLFDAHSYPKGACVLHMLRFILGDKAFFRVWKEFLHDYAFQAVDTHDFMKTVKEVTGENMDWFFEQWIFKPGHPVFEIKSSWNEETKTMGLTIRQVQDTSRNIPIYKTPVLIGIRLGKSYNQTSPSNTTVKVINQNELEKENAKVRAKHKKVDESIEKREGDWPYPTKKKIERWAREGDEIVYKIWITEAEEYFEFPIKSKPLMVRFDRGNYLLKEWCFSKSREELLFQAQNDDVIGRLWAVGELKKFKDNSQVIKSIMKIARKDSFWAVRKAAVETIGAWAEERFIPFLRDCCLDKHSRVRAAALRSLADFRRPELAAFFKERFSRENSYLAQAEALKAIGKTGDKNQISFLEKASKIPSYRHIIKNAALEALKLLQSPLKDN